MPRKPPRKRPGVGWTLRLPPALAKRVRARAAALNAREGGPRWSGNAVMVAAIERGLKSVGESEVPRET